MLAEMHASISSELSQGYCNETMSKAVMMADMMYVNTLTTASLYNTCIFVTTEC